MPTENSTVLIEDLSMQYRLQRPENASTQDVYLMLHGWSGNENVMWVFAQHFPQGAWILSPRGIYSSPEGGYGWTETRGWIEAKVEDFCPAIDQISTWFGDWLNKAGILHPRVTLVGFSQGAALSYSLGYTRKLPVGRIVGLAGYLPHSVGFLHLDNPFAGMPVFIAHGTKDDIVPIDRARQSAAHLQQAGAQVTYCESDVGHKLGVNCLHSMATFLNTTSARESAV